MSFFGDDTDDLFTTLDDTYFCKIGVEVFKSKVDSRMSNVKVTYTVENPDVEEYGETHEEWLKTYPGFSKDDRAALPRNSDDRKVITRDRIKSDSNKTKNRFNQLGITDSEMRADGWDPDGLEVYADVTFKSSEDNNGRIWVNINKITLVDMSAPAPSTDDGPMF